MTDLPERIWATPYDPEMDGGTYCDAKERPTAPNHDAWRYVRADTVQAQIDAAVAAERERCAKVADAQEAVAIAREEKSDHDESDWAFGVVFGTKIGACKIAAAIRKGDQP